MEPWVLLISMMIWDQPAFPGQRVGPYPDEVTCTRAGRHWMKEERKWMTRSHIPVQSVGLLYSCRPASEVAEWEWSVNLPTPEPQ